MSVFIVHLISFFNTTFMCVSTLHQVANCENKPDFTLSPSSPATTSTPSVTTAVASNLASVSRMLSADELDVTVAKHPASITARFIIVQQALRQQVRHCFAVIWLSFVSLELSSHTQTQFKIIFITNRRLRLVF